MASTVIVHATPSPTVMDIPPTSTAPPIVQFAYVAGSIISTAFSGVSLFFASIWSLVKTILSPISRLLLALSSPLLYLLSPVIVLANILLEVLILAPYSFFSGFVKAVYPIYVFVGAACIVAALVGLCARGAVHFLHASIFEPADQTIAPLSPSRRGPPGKAEPEGPRVKAGKKVSIKEEVDVKTVRR